MIPQGSGETHLELAKVGPVGQALGLRPGDKLVGLNGEPFTQGARALASKFSSREDKKIALHFQRADVDLMVLSVTPKLGRWRPCPIAGTSRIAPMTKGKVDNWEVLRSREGVYDIYRHRAPKLAIYLPLLWLAQMRLWPHMAGFVALVALGFPAGIWAMVALWFLGGTFLWRSYALLIRSDRSHHGMYPYAVLAAPSEMAAHAAYLHMEPEDQFAYGEIVLQDKPDGPREATA